MGADNRRIDKELAAQRTGIRLEPLPELAPEPAPFPAAQAVIDCVPVAKRLWQVTPGCPSAGQVQYGFDEHPIAEHRRTASTGFHSGEDGGNLRPCRIRQQQTYRHQVSSRMYRMNGREKTYPGILNSSTRPSLQVYSGIFAGKNQVTGVRCLYAYCPRGCEEHAAMVTTDRGSQASQRPAHLHRA